MTVTKSTPPKVTTVIPEYQQKIADLFIFLSELCHLKTPQQQTFSPEPWSYYWDQLPVHPLVQQGLQGSLTPTVNESELRLFLKVTRPKSLSCPLHPAVLSTWLTPVSYQTPETPPQFILQREHPAPTSKTEPLITASNRVDTHSDQLTEMAKPFIVERFEDDAARVMARDRWLKEWYEWAERVKRDRPVYELFQKLYKLHTLLDQEGGQLELVWQDGWLLASTDAGLPLHMPLISLKAQIVFDSKEPSFTLELLEDTPAELNTGVLGRVRDLPHNAISTIKAELEAQGYHPAETSDCMTYLHGLTNRLGAEAQFSDKPLNERAMAVYPQVYTRPVLTVRKREAGLANALKQVADTLQQNCIDHLSWPLIHLVGGGEESSDEYSEEENEETFNGSRLRLPHLDSEVLFSKPANQEQLDIAHRLARHGAVLVQGPPGTGKTHTIANLIGHLLAQGKSILVTAHTSKALKVVRDKVVPTLQGLCVNVLDSDSESKRLLEASIDTISDRLGHINPAAVQREIDQLEATRNRLITETLEQQAKLRAIIQSEYEPIVVSGENYTPSQAAQCVAEGTGRHDWLPGPISNDALLPLSLSDLKALYASQLQITAEEEAKLSDKLPQLSQLPIPAEFTQWVRQWHQWHAVLESKQDSTVGENLLESLQEDVLENLLQEVELLTQQLEQSDSWQKALIQLSLQSNELTGLWQQLLDTLKPLHDMEACIQADQITRNPQLPKDISLNEQIALLEELVTHFDHGKSLGFTERLFKKHWFLYLDKISCYGKPLTPNSVMIADLRALRELAQFQQTHEQTCLRWDQLMSRIGGPESTTLGTKPLSVMMQYQPRLQEWLDWRHVKWQPLCTSLETTGLNLDAVMSEQPICTDERTGLVERLHLALNQGVRPHFQVVLACKKTSQLQAKFDQVVAYLKHFTKEGTALNDLYALHQAVVSRDDRMYAHTHEQLRELLARYELFIQRKDWLSRLAEVAPDWARLIAQRQPGHDISELPGNIQKAWTYRQLSQVLDERHAQSLVKVQEHLALLHQQLMQVTADLIEQRAWLAQKRRVGIQQQQALEGWKKTIQKIGKGTGKKAPALRLEAQALMKQCKEAVPVWIMPFNRVVENFSPLPNTVDVVIVDEASQLDLRGLVLFFMAKQVIVVGDDKQVTPDAVGQQVDKEMQLQQQWLNGRIPNSKLYDGKASIYDRAKEVFGQTIMLKEHFRCVPDIIEYCNILSYDGKVSPLRDPSVVAMKPHWIPIYVPESFQQGKMNPKEAQYTASLIAACLNDPAFILPSGQPVTIGMISLFGDDQAVAVDRILKEKIEPSLLERHAVQCSNAAQFQGDERDVMFLSMMYAPTDSGSPHNRMEFGVDDMYRKRFNVAVSRAKDQVWLIHSLRPEIDLKPNDIRRNLLEYATNPQAKAIQIAQKEPLAESPFEKAVLRDLITAGYRVTPQWKVGSYRIDLVVTGSNGTRVAIECDGEKYHGSDRLADDLARQAQLEHLGWQFIRIRGSQYYRKPKDEMKRVMTALADLNIHSDCVAKEESPVTNHEITLLVRIQASAAQIREQWIKTQANERQ